MTNKFGFIENPLVRATYNNDAFVPAMALQGFSIGDTVNFELVIKNGNPQAHNVRIAGPVNTGMIANNATPTGKAFNGVIKSKKENYAFIHCDTVKQAMNTDVFCPAAALRDSAEGDTVNFELVLNAKQQPQATNVSKVYLDGSQVNAMDG